MVILGINFLRRAGKSPPGMTISFGLGRLADAAGALHFNMSASTTAVRTERGEDVTHARAWEYTIIRRKIGIALEPLELE